MKLSRRSLLKATAVGGAAVTLGSGVGSGAVTSSKANAAPIIPNAKGEWLVGLGMADVTGACAGQGMMGFAQPEQVAHGIRQRYLARAVIIIDKKTNTPMVHVTVDTCAVFQNIVDAVMARVRKMYGNRYPMDRVMITATHNHNSCGGTAQDVAYYMSSSGHMENSAQAEIDGIVEAIKRAHENIKPGELLLGRSKLYNASANRSRSAFERNPAADKKEMPNGIDPRVWVLRIKQGGVDKGLICWFATHGTSLTDQNMLLSPDNKGLAAYIFEHDHKGVDYQTDPSRFVAAFAQTNAGDLSPNLFLRKLKPGGPTDDNVLNNAIIAKRQYDACHKAWESATPLTGAGIQGVYRFQHMDNYVVRPEFTQDGKQWKTVRTVMGGAGAASSEEDNYNSFTDPWLKEGVKGPLTPFWDWNRENGIEMDWNYQSPKLNFLPLGYAPVKGWIPQEMPLSIVRLGDLVIVCGPLEYTAVSGLRCRRVVAKKLGVPMENVIMQGYTNSYIQYCTTPEEYDDQQYEGGETQFGRETLGAHLQIYSEICDVMLGKKKAPKNDTDRAYLHNTWIPSWLPKVPADTAPKGKKYGDVLQAPPSRVQRGSKLTVSFVGAHPNNRLYRGGSYHEVQKNVGGRWVRIADDFHYDTIYDWERPEGSKTESIIKIHWNIPKNQAAGTYRIVIKGDAKAANGKLTHFKGVTKPFKVA